jgi:hypothetical protein
MKLWNPIFSKPEALKYDVAAQTAAQSVAPMTPEEARARGKRNVAIALALAAFVAVVFVMTIVRLQGQVPGLPSN